MDSDKIQARYIRALQRQRTASQTGHEVCWTVNSIHLVSALRQTSSPFVFVHHFNPSNYAEATFIQSTKMQFFSKPFHVGSHWIGFQSPFSSFCIILFWPN